MPRTDDLLARAPPPAKAGASAERDKSAAADTRGPVPLARVSGAEGDFRSDTPAETDARADPADVSASTPTRAEPAVSALACPLTEPAGVEDFTSTVVFEDDDATCASAVPAGVDAFADTDAVAGAVGVVWAGGAEAVALTAAWDCAGGTDALAETEAAGGAVWTLVDTVAVAAGVLTLAEAVTVGGGGTGRPSACAGTA